jgi:hypothetical protein
LGGVAEFVIADGALFAGVKHLGFKRFDGYVQILNGVRNGLAARRTPGFNKTAREGFGRQASV